MTKFRQLVESLLENSYERPYNAEEILKTYGQETYDKLMNDPCHRWRAETGIELIHKEPTQAEFDRIWKNWQLMSDEDKRKSDEKSIEIFGIDNQTHYDKIKEEYIREYLEQLAKNRDEDREETYNMYRRW